MDSGYRSSEQRLEPTTDKDSQCRAQVHLNILVIAFNIHPVRSSTRLREEMPTQTL